MVGAAMIAADIALPLSPAFVVAGYGATLLYSEIVFLVPHADLTNNSPYFLGLLFFLTSLLRTFWTTFSLTNEAQLAELIRQMGGALLATLVGLPIRQLLFAYSPSQNQQDTFFRTLEEELRRSATEFKRSQLELVGLVQEFVETRKTIFSEEERASRRYIRILEKAIALFDNGPAEYPAIIAAALGRCTASLETLESKSQQLARAAEQISIESLTQVKLQFDSLREKSAAVSQSMADLQAALSGLKAQAVALPEEVGLRLRGASDDFDNARTQMKTKAEEIQRDVGEIDRLLTDFTDLMKERLLAEK